MARKSRDKGASGERELARKLSRLLGVEARRGYQYRGGPGRYERQRVGASAPGQEDAVRKETADSVNQQGRYERQRVGASAPEEEDAVRKETADSVNQRDRYERQRVGASAPGQKDAVRKETADSVNQQGRYERQRVGASAPGQEDAVRKETAVDMNPGEPDVVADIPDVHIECKRTERLRLYDALEQAIGDAGQKVPVVMHRQNRKPWVAIVRLEDLPKLAVQVYLTLAENA